MNHDREQHLPQTNTQEKLLHSGNFEGKLQEDHYDKKNASSVQEFKGFDTDQLQQVAPAPETSGALILTDEERSSREFQEKTDYYKQKPAETETGWTPTGSDAIKDSVEHTKDASNKRLWIRMGGAAAGLALALGTYMGISNSGDKDPATPLPDPKQTSSSPASPAPSETAAPIKTETGPSIAELKATSPEAFNKLPRSQRMVLVKNMLTYADSVFGYYVAQGTEGMSEHNPLNKAAANNNAEETMKQLWYEMQMPYRQNESQDPDDTSLDRPAALKALNAAFYYVDTDKTPTGIYTFMKKELSQKTDIAPISYDYTDIEEITPLHDAVDNEGNPIKIKTIGLLDKGVPHTLNVVFSEIDSTHGIWQIYEEL